LKNGVARKKPVKAGFFHGRFLGRFQGRRRDCEARRLENGEQADFLLAESPEPR